MGGYRIPSERPILASMKIALAILTLVVSTAAFLTFIVFCLAGGANASQRDIVILKSAMIGMLLTWVGSMGGGIWAMIAGRLGLAIGLGALPAALATLLVIVAIITEF